MLETDLKGLWISLKNNNIFHLLILLGICLILYTMLSRYVDMQNRIKNNFGNTGYSGSTIYGNINANVNEIPKMDELIIKNMINLPNRNPAMLTSSMIVPEPSQPTDEARRRTRMDILNMFYNSFDDDNTTISSRPQNLYIIP